MDWIRGAGEGLSGMTRVRSEPLKVWRGVVKSLGLDMLNFRYLLDMQMDVSCSKSDIPGWS